MKCLLLSLAFAAIASAQWLDLKAPGVPRLADGKPNLNAPWPKLADGHSDFSGLWRANNSASFGNILGAGNDGIMLPWAAKLYAERKNTIGRGFMSVTCMPFGPVSAIRFEGGVARVIQSPTVIGILFSDQTHRQIHLDGRALPKDPNPSWMGYSTGHWEGDTLVVESNGFNDLTWLDTDGHPHTEHLRLTERLRRRDFGHIDVEATYTDPEAYREPIVVKTVMNATPDEDIVEYLCRENETSLTHMIGTRDDGTAKPIEVPVTVLSRYVGVYTNTATGNTYTISLEGGQLRATQSGTGRVSPLTPISETMFTGLPLEFQKNAQGAVTGFAMLQSGDVLTRQPDVRQ